MAKKVIIPQTPPNLLGQARVSFDKTMYEAAIWNKGYSVWHEKTIACPCKTKGVENRPNCKNCGGTGWVFLNKIKTRMLLHSMNLNTKFKEWSEEKVGTTSITCMDRDKISFMDKITLEDSISIHTEVLYPVMYQDVLFSYTTYKVKEIIALFMFVESDEKLKKLETPADFVADENIITFNEKYINRKDFRVSVMYNHYVSFYVIDVVRDMMNVFYIDELTGKEQNQQMPIHGVGRRLHYVIDITKINGERLLDNSYELETTCET